MRTPLRILLPILVLCSMVVPEAGHATGEVTFTKVLDSDTTVPGEDASFGAFDLDERMPGRRRLDADPHIAMDDEGNLAFSARGMFAIVDGNVHRVPFFGDLQAMTIDEARVTFGVLGGARLGSIFRWEQGTTPVKVIGAQTFVPDGGACVFWTKEDGVSYWPFLVDGDAILFSGTSNERAYADGQDFDCDDLEGNFLWLNGSIERLSFLANPVGHSVDNGLIAFDEIGAIHTQELGGARVRLVGPGDPIPGGSGIFQSVSGPAVAAGRVAFWGRDAAGKTGVYLWESGAVSVLAEEGMQLPGGRRLERPSAFRLGDDRVGVFGADSQGPLVYLASLKDGWDRVLAAPDVGITNKSMGEFDGGQLLLVGEAVYVVRGDGSLMNVLRRGDSLDGRRVAEVHPGDLRKNRLPLGIRFEGSFTDHLYVAELPPLSVEIDVKPHSATNPVNPRSRRSIPVAILGSETFPVEDMDVASVRVGPGAAPARGRPKLRDVNGDGWTDLVLRFRPRETGLGRGDTEVCLSGKTDDSVPFEGCDAVSVRR